MPERALISRIGRGLNLSGVLALVGALVAHLTGPEVVADVGPNYRSTIGAVWVLGVLGVLLIINGSIIYNWLERQPDEEDPTTTDPRSSS